MSKNLFHKPAGTYKPIVETSIQNLSVGNRFRLMYNLPLLPENMNTIENTNHSEMVKLLVKSPQDIIESLDCAKCHLLHMYNGILDEYFEYITAPDKDKENKKEELGDLLFYWKGLGLDPNLIKATELRHTKFDPIEKALLLLSTVVKRHVFYNQELDIQTFFNCYQNIWQFIEHRAAYHGFLIREIEQANKQKLWKRYKNFVYSDEQAKQRKDKTTS